MSLYREMSEWRDPETVFGQVSLGSMMSAGSKLQPEIRVFTYAADPRGIFDAMRKPFDGECSNKLLLSAIYYCQGVIRANTTGSRTLFKELEAGMSDIEKHTQGFVIPGFETGPSPQLAYRFADLAYEEWAAMYNASTSARDELMKRVAFNVSAGFPISEPLSLLLFMCVRERGKPRNGATSREATEDRDTLFVYLAKRVSDVTGLPITLGNDRLHMAPLNLSGITIAAVSFSSLGQTINIARSKRIWEDKKALLDDANQISYKLRPDFFVDVAPETPSSASSGKEFERYKQMEKAIGLWLDPVIRTD